MESNEMNDNKHPVQDFRFILTLLMVTLCCLGVAMYLRLKSDTNMYQFLTWDIFLAWVPYIISSCIRYTFNKKVTKLSLIWIVPMSAGWLFSCPIRPTFSLKSYIHSDISIIKEKPNSGSILIFGIASP